MSLIILTTFTYIVVKGGIIQSDRSGENPHGEVVESTREHTNDQDT